MKLKSIFTFLFIFILILVGLFASLPSIASTQWGNAQLIKAINLVTSQTVKAEKISLSWLGPQSIRGVEIKNAQGQPVLSFDQASLNAPLINLFWNRQLEGDLHVSSLRASIIQEAETSSIKDVNAELLFSSGMPLTLSLSGLTEHGELSGQFQVDLEFAGLKPEQFIKVDRHLIDLFRENPEAHLKIKANISNFPVHILDRGIAYIKPELAGVLVSALGKNLNFSIDQILKQDKMNLSLQAQSPQLTANVQADFALEKEGTILIASLHGKAIQNGQEMTFKTSSTEWSIADQLTLLQPATLQADLNASILNRSLLRNFSTKLQNDSSVEILLQELSTSLTHFDPDAVRLKTEINFAPLYLSRLPAIDRAQVNDLKVNLFGDSIREMRCESLMNIAQADEQLRSILGSPIQLAVNSKVGISPSNEIVIHHFDTQINSQLLTAYFEGKIVNRNQILLTAPAQINFTMSPEALNFLRIKPSTMKVTPLQLTLNSPAPLDFSNLSLLHLMGQLKIDELVFSTGDRAVDLQQLLVSWDLDGFRNTLQADFDGNTLLSANTGKLSGALFIKDWLKNNQIDLKQASLRTHTNLSDVPVGLFAPFIPELDLLSLVGSSINLSAEADVNLAESKEGILKLKADSDHMHAQGAFKIDEAISLQKDNDPAFIRLTLTPQGYTAIRNFFRGNIAKDFILTEPTSVFVDLKSLSLPLDRHGKYLLPYWEGALSADLTIGHVRAFIPSNGKKMDLKKLHAQLNSGKLSNKIHFQVKSEDSMTASGTIDNGFTEDGALNREHLSLETDIKMNAFPADLLCQLACLDPNTGKKIQVIFGDMINGDIKLKLEQMNGPVYAEFKGKNGQLFLDGQLDQKHLTLNKALELSVVLTPELGQYVLQDYFPFLSGMISSNQPLKIKIDPKEFSLPLFPLNTVAAEISHGMIDLGKVQFANSGQLGNVLSLIIPIKQDYLSVWLTPIYFSLHNGSLKLERVDMLISEQYPIAAWGKVNLIKDKVNMIIALSGLAISKAFNVPIQDKNYFLQLPLKGTMSSASIDKAKATSRISSLVAQSQGSPHGYLIGTFLDITSGNLSEKKAPPPTTNPLPWSHILQEEDKPSETTNPLQEIEKGANLLLKSIFNP